MAEANNNKIRYGLSNVHVGKVTFENGTPTFGTPKAYPGAVNITMDPEGESTPFYADNIVYYMATSNNGYTGDLEMAYLYDWFETEYLGHKTSSEGMIVETADAKPSNMYIMFQFEGDVKATKHILYNVHASRPSVEGSTKEDTTTPATTTIPYTAMPLQTTVGQLVKGKVPANASNYADFFTKAPVLPTFAAAQQ